MTTGGIEEVFMDYEPTGLAQELQQVKHQLQDALLEIGTLRNLINVERNEFLRQRNGGNDGNNNQGSTAQGATMRTSPRENLTPSGAAPVMIQPSPEKFDGNPKGVRSFLSQVVLNFALYPSQYTTDMQKISYIGSLLKGRAADWLTPLIETNDPVLLTYAGFLNAFKTAFEDTNREAKAVEKIMSINQGNRPLHEYITEFKQVAHDLKWNEEALIPMFRAGLNGKILDIMKNINLPKTLQEAY